MGVGIHHPHAVGPAEQDVLLPAEIYKLLLQLPALLPGFAEPVGKGPGGSGAHRMHLLENGQYQVATQQNRHHVHPVPRPTQLGQRGKALHPPQLPVAGINGKNLPRESQLLQVLQDLEPWTRFLRGAYNGYGMGF